MEEHLHSSTVTVALRILVVLLSNQSILNRFREGLCGGGWLDHTDSVLTNKIGTVLGESTAQVGCMTGTEIHLIRLNLKYSVQAQFKLRQGMVLCKDVSFLLPQFDEF